ncbi:type II toxin-antitoxin system Phd/YefM family antitoxin [Desulfurivibrio dismutans]|uniref:type II toxin-antitoxin system Phd/YefM family antitoxin n=1 Tax=Desulfurivibrio dismutans TaxID=1398908 RepID=UPI0023DBD17D|nr:type II toxin-antitoxin system Phd/YefM family antitoxin [Desulfurivibrio alkaliphilus]MDF1615805.1 type II toxin-antitoxin system Phd/YefM family antitoxin [Desulfurivibrio alkaliphilus]
MKAYQYSVARKRLSELLDTAKKEEVLIKRRGGETFSLVYKKTSQSPFDVPGITTKSTTGDILGAIRESREG